MVRGGCLEKQCELHTFGWLHGEFFVRACGWRSEIIIGCRWVLWVERNEINCGRICDQLLRVRNLLVPRIRQNARTRILVRPEPSRLFESKFTYFSLVFLPVNFLALISFAARDVCHYFYGSRTATGSTGSSVNLQPRNLPMQKSSVQATHCVLHSTACRLQFVVQFVFRAEVCEQIFSQRRFSKEYTWKTREAPRWPVRQESAQSFWSNFWLSRWIKFFEIIWMIIIIW